MGRTKENPRYELLSFRVTEEEYQEIYELAKTQAMNISDYIRRRLFNGTRQT